MRTATLLLAALLFALYFGVPEAMAGDKKDKEPPPEDPALIGEEVTDQSEVEKILYTEYRKRRSPHFFVQTSYDMEACKQYTAFCETQYKEFLKWAGKPEDFELWGTRASVGVIHNKAEWECLMKHYSQGLSPFEIEERKKVGGLWDAGSLMKLEYSSEGRSTDQDKEALFHSLCHLFLAGLQKSGRQGTVWWLYESFSKYRETEVFGAQLGGCINFETKAKTDDERAWHDIDDWVTLLKRDMRQKQDEDFILFWHKDLSAIQHKTYVKGWSIIRWMCRDEKNKAKFVTFLENLKTKNDQDKALRMAFDMDAEKIDKEWREWLKHQPARWRKGK